MKTIVILLAVFCLPLFGHSQTAIEKLKDLTNTLTQPQDTSKSKASGTSGSGSNLAVSDEGASGGKGKSQKTVENPIEKLKHNLTEKAVENEKNNSNSSPAGTSNLAVSDEGASGKQGKNNSKENTGTPNTTNVTPSPTDPPKTGTATEGPK